METTDILGLCAFIITTIYTCFGLPVQIRKNYLQKSAAGLSLLMSIMLFFTFNSWVIYAFVKSPKDWYVVASNLPGVVCITIILYQFFIYRNKGKKD
jgi:uncharacterized protein with PQ loop repeat